MASQRPLTSFKCLTFDCYGTLVDWEGGIYTALGPLTQQLPTDHSLYNNRPATLKAFIKHETSVQIEHPTELYSKVLAAAYTNFAAELGVSTNEQDAARFGGGVGDWPVFPDTIHALQRLKKHFKLVILSNVDKDSFSRTLAKQFVGIEFDAIYVAEEIGSYKPDLRNFEYLIAHCEKDLGVKKEDIIHTAQSLFHDQVPATTIGLTCAWIERGEDVESVMGGNLEALGDKVKLSWRYKNMGAFADAFEQIA